MKGRLAALILLGTLAQTTDVPPQIPLVVVELDGSLNLSCQKPPKPEGFFCWYKVKLGDMIQTVAQGAAHNIALQGQFANSRFTVTERGALYLLNIDNVSKEDEAMYICQSGPSYARTFMNGTLVAVKDSRNQKNSFHVKQIPATASVQVGNSVRFQCSLLFKSKDCRGQCPGEHNVYWFRAGSGESQPGVLYTHAHGSDMEERKSCVYGLSKTMEDSADIGTYYCAVVTCGEILFGEGTKVDTKTGVELDPFVVVFGTLLVCCVIVIIALIIFRNQKSRCEHCKGEGTASNQAACDKSAEEQSNNVDGEAVEQYAALNFSSRKREKRTSDRERQEHCTYSTIRGCQ